MRGTQSVPVVTIGTSAMSVQKPFRRTVRQFVDGSYDEGGRSGYIEHSKFAKTPEHYIRAFLLIQKDLLELFDFVEPADKNLDCYSYRIHELLMRTCIEVEANCKAILSDNNYVRSGNWNMDDYKKLNPTHRLSSYKIRFPLWHGAQNIVQPFAAWASSSGGLTWYQAYNTTKHDRHAQFESANFRNLLGAVAGLASLLGAQFLRNDFSRVDYIVAGGIPADGFETAIGGYFLIRHPDDWPVGDRYDFNWQALETQTDPFQDLTF